jgi:hypothetical protein
MLKKLLLTIACAGALQPVTAQAHIFSIQKPEQPILVIYAAASFGIGFWANFISQNTKEQKVISNIAGLGLTAALNGSSTIKNTLTVGTIFGAGMVNQLNKIYRTDAQAAEGFGNGLLREAELAGKS